MLIQYLSKRYAKLFFTECGNPHPNHPAQEPNSAFSYFASMVTRTRDCMVGGGGPGPSH